MIYLALVATPESFGPAFIFAVGIFVGALWSTLLLFAFQWIDRVGPVRRDLAAAYRAIALAVRAAPADHEAFAAAQSAAGHRIEQATTDVGSTGSSDMSVVVGSARRLWLDAAGLHEAATHSGASAIEEEIDTVAAQIEAVADSLDRRRETERSRVATVPAVSTTTSPERFLMQWRQSEQISSTSHPRVWRTRPKMCAIV